MRWQTSLTFLLIYAIVGGRQCQRISRKRLLVLKKRAILDSYSSNFHIGNVTFQCNETNSPQNQQLIRNILAQDAVLIRRVSRLKDEDMQHLLRYKGGTFIPEYLASNFLSARKTFVNPLNIRKAMLANFAKVGEKLERFSNLQNGLLFGNRTRTLQSRTGDRTSNRKHSQLYAMGILNPSLPRRTMRKRRDSSGQLDEASQQVLVNKVCFAAGDPTAYNPNFLRLCNVCSANLLLPEDNYPNVLNQIICDGENGGCLGGKNGKCVPTIFKAKILKRREDICRLCVKDSEVLAMNEWEISSLPISVGCECMLDKASSYRKLWFSKTGLANGAIG